MKEKQGDNEGSWSEGGTSNGFPPSCYPIRNRGSLRSTSQGEAFPSWNRFVGETISQISLVSLFIGRKLFALESFLPLWAGEKGRGRRQLVRYANRGRFHRPIRGGIATRHFRFLLKFHCWMQDWKKCWRMEEDRAGFCLWQKGWQFKDNGRKKKERFYICGMDILFLVIKFFPFYPV